MPSVLLSFQQAPSTPRTQSQLDALISRRDELSEQFQSVTHRRGMLAQERLNAEARASSGAGGTQDRAMIKELEAQVSELGQRSSRIQRELNQTEDAIAKARANGVGQEGEAATPAMPAIPAIPAIPAMPRMEEFFSVNPQRDQQLAMQYKKMMAFEALAFVLLGAIGARFLWRAALRRGSRETPVAGMSGMQQALDVIAVEVERISENQRYVTKMLSEQAGAGARAENARAGKVNVGDR